MTDTGTVAGKRQQRWPVGRASEIAPGERRLVEVKGHAIGLFNVGGRFVAALNLCPHELAPVCRGRVGGTTLPRRPASGSGVARGRSWPAPGTAGSSTC